MAELRPYPFGALVTRAFRELEERGSVFDLPRARFHEAAAGGPDLGVRFHGRRAATPLGPAAGPQSQMAQNVVLSWLAGSRIVELKTVQVLDQLEIPRPCIDARTVGFNVEWSQELRIAQSLEEYVKGAMLVEMLAASGMVPAGREEAAATVYDMSVGYDLAGIRSEGVQAFLDGMLDCRAIVDRLRGEIPERWRHLRDLDFRTRLSDTLTLSTFHGCPPDEIERIVDFLLRERGLHCVVKLNPMLLGPERTRELLHDVLGYTDLRVPDSAFERDARWDQAVGFVERLGDTARGLGLGFGVKLTNTLIVENEGDFLPREARERYLSGPPLHVLAMDLVGRFRATFGDRVPISFSAGIDRRNFHEAAALGLVPITVCTDWLRPGGYARGRGYLDELRGRMEAAGAGDLEEWCVRAMGKGGEALGRLGLARDDPRQRACGRALEERTSTRAAAGDELHARWAAEAALLNTAAYVEGLARNPRYRREANSRTPRKIGSRLELLDCISCDKCVPVCPNDANFVYELPAASVPIVKLRREDGAFRHAVEGELAVEHERQYANFADFCNDCGNCDVFCPEDGGPYVVKPRFFGRLEDWRRQSHLDGLCRDRRSDGREVLHARCGGSEFELEADGARHVFRGSGFELSLDPEDPLRAPAGWCEEEVDLTWYALLRRISDAVYGSGAPTYPSLVGG